MAKRKEPLIVENPIQNSNSFGECLSCKLSLFGNFGNIEGELIGGELFLLKELIERKIILPCELARPLDDCFDIWSVALNSLNTLSDDQKENVPMIFVDDTISTPLLFFIYPCFSDLKASLFLALTGHYRAAHQLLRPLVENIIVGRTIEEKLRRATKEKKFTKECDKFFDWLEDNRVYDFNGSIDYLGREGLIDVDEKNRLKNELWEELHRYIHPYISKWSPHEKPMVTQYNATWLFKWIDIYENILSYIMEVLFQYYPWISDIDETKLALIELSDWYSLDEEFDRLMIKSEYMKKFIITHRTIQAKGL